MTTAKALKADGPIRVVDYVAKYLSARGVDQIFMLPGTGSIHLDDVFGDPAGPFEYVCARHEAAAVTMASGYSKLSGKLGVTITTTGPGGINALAGASEAWIDSVPVLIISGQEATTSLDADRRSFGAQGFDIVQCAIPMTKYAAIVRTPQDIRFHLDRAVHAALHDRQGPVWLDIPADVQMATITPQQLRTYTPEPPPHDLTSMDAHIARQLRDKLAHAARPLIIAGGGLRRSGFPVFAELIRTVSVPVVATRAAIDVLPYEHPLFYGQAGARGRYFGTGLLANSDFVLCFGCSMADALVGENCRFLNSHAEVISLNCEDPRLTRPRHTVILTDAEAAARALLQQTTSTCSAPIPDHHEWVAYCSALKAQHPTCSLSEHRGGEPNAINSYAFILELERLTNHQHVFVTDAGGAYYAAGQALEFNNGQRELTSCAFATMGLALPLAIGACAADHSKQAIVVVGDGSIELNIQELRTLSLEKSNVKVFVLNNGGYASIRASQDEFCGSRYTDPRESLEFEQVARAFGLPYRRIGSHDEITTIVPLILAENGPELIEVMCDPEQKMIVPPGPEQWSPHAPP